MFALHPEHQEKAFQEILTVMPNKDSNLTQSDLDKLEFTELCIKETLRILPTVAVTGRIATNPIKLSNGIELPSNVPIIIGIRQIQHNEDYYGPTAHLFDPYRFSEGKIKNLPDAAYIPFGYGPRNCIGERKLQFKFSDLIHQYFL